MNTANEKRVERLEAELEIKPKIPEWAHPGLWCWDYLVSIDFDLNKWQADVNAELERLGLLGTEEAKAEARKKLDFEKEALSPEDRERSDAEKRRRHLEALARNIRKLR